MSRLTIWSSSPFGPLTETKPGLISTSTPSGITTGFFPIRLIGSPYVRHDLAADASLPRLVARHHANRGREDRRPHPAHDARYLVVGDVSPPARPRHPLQPRDHRAAPVRVLELDPNRLSNRRGLDRVLADVALLGEDPRHLLLQAGCGHLDLGVLRGDRVANAGQVVGYRVGHHRRAPGPITSWTWSSRGCTPCARGPSGTAGRGRTCDSRRASARSAGSGCSPGSCTSACALVVRLVRSWPFSAPRKSRLRLRLPRTFLPRQRSARPLRLLPPRGVRASHTPPGSPP